MKTPFLRSQKQIVVSLLLVTGWLFPCQAQVAPTSCCSVSPWKLTTGAHSIMEAFGDLLAGLGVQECNKNTASTIGAVPSLPYTMPAKHYSNSGLPGVITFVAFFQPEMTIPIHSYDGSDKFRIIWNSGSVNGVKTYPFEYYGVCRPEPIIFPASSNNDVFAFKLIPVATYQNLSGVKNFTTLSSLNGIKIIDVASIVEVSLEEKGGYIAATEGENYNSPFSSKGVVVRVRLKNDRTVPCYLISNYDNNTVTWKQRNNCWNDIRLSPLELNWGKTDQQASDPLVIKPNPSSGLFRLEGLPPGQVQVKVYSITGKLVSSSMARVNARGDVGIDLKGQPDGIYQLRVIAPSGKVVRARVLIN